VIEETSLGRVWILIKDAHPGMLAGLFALCMLSTTLKIRRMAIIRGWIPGREVVEKVLAQKWHQEVPHERFWISTDKNNDIRIAHSGRIQVSTSSWNRIQIGQPITLVKAPGDSEFYLQNDIYSSPGNLVFDAFLLTGELIMFLWMLLRCFWNL
jgi:hypothetical protein